MRSAWRRFPWATAAISLLAGLALNLEAVTAFLIYDRAQILAGQVWRTWTGHVVHYGPSHLWWNLAVIVPVGIGLERLWPVLTRWFYLVCPLAISLVLLRFDPSLLHYAGLSGLATGMLVLLAGLQLRRRKSEPAWFWLLVLGLVGGKIVLESITGEPLFVSGFVDVRTVPLAHIAGLGCAAITLAAAILLRSAPLFRPVEASRVHEGKT